MKKLGFLNKVIFFLNSVAAAVLLLSYFLQYVPPKSSSFLSVLSLAVPVLIILNVLFFVYWLIKLKKQLFLSLLVLLIGYKYIGSLYKFSNSKDKDNASNLSVMTYNVRLFNKYNWIPEKGVQSSIVKLIEIEKPDVLSMQEYQPLEDESLSIYKYKFEKLQGKKTKYGQAIFSKFPIINSGSIDFPNTANNAIFADIIRNNDTVRVYNLHLQSLGINPNVESINKEESERLFRRLSSSFRKQQEQTELFLEHKNKSPYKVIVCGDFNNTAYSYVYKKISKNLQDAFEEAGSGFGKTFDFRSFPIRIDFILVDKGFSVNGFKTYQEKLSDHYPILTKIGLH